MAKRLSRTKRELPWLAALAAFGLLALSPLWRGSGPAAIHSAVHWDTLEYHWPALAYASDAVRAGELPLWNPFQRLGFPMAMDPQSQAWAPASWLAFAAGGYGILAFQAQLIGLWVWAGLGAFAAARVLGRPRPAAWLAGASWMLGGYFAGHAGHLGTFATLAWFPWALAAALKSLEGGGRFLSWTALAGLALAQGAAGGHPTTALVAGYNLAAAWLLWPGRLPFGRRLGLLALAGGIAAMCCAPQLGGIWAGREFFGKLGPEGLARSEQNALLPRNFLAFLLPGLANVRPGEFFGNDITMIPLHAGLLAPAGLLIALRARLRRRREGALALLAGANLLAAVGPASAVRRALFFWAPAMDLPRHAAMDFRGFALLFGILLASAGWAMLLAGLRAGRARLLGSFGKCAGVSAAFLALLGLAAGLAGAASPGLGDRADFGLVVDELFVQALFLGLFGLWAAWAGGGTGPRKPSRQAAAFGLLALAALDLASSLGRTWPIAADVADANAWPALLKLSRERPRDFAPEQFLRFGEEPNGWRGNIGKAVELDAYNPLALLNGEGRPRTAEEFREAFPGLFPRRAALLDPTGTRPVAGEAELARLSPNSMAWKVSGLREPAKLRVLSSWAPGWTRALAGAKAEAVPRSPAGPHFLEAPVPAGESEVVFRYEPGWIGPCLALMLAGYALGLALALPGAFRKNGTLPRSTTKAAPTGKQPPAKPSGKKKTGAPTLSRVEAPAKLETLPKD